MGIIVFNGVSSRDVGIEVETFPTYDVPEKEFETVHVPGRNGDVIFGSGTYKNINAQYKVSIATRGLDYHQKMRRVSEWLHSSQGYVRLEDSYMPEFYRLAYYKDPVSIENLFNEAGRATIKFICKPQKFFKSGEIAIPFLSAGAIQNRTNELALPLIQVNTNNTEGSVTIGDCTFTILANAGTSITIDSELQDAYAGTVNKNSFLRLDDGEFPAIKPGTNNISMSGGVQSISITPRWWTT